MVSPSSNDFKNIEQNNSVKNCFFIWSNSLILILTAIPVFSYFASKIFNLPVWNVPKVYELKMYALALIACALLSLLSLYSSEFFRRAYTKYQTYLLFFYPLAIFIYSIIPDGLWRYLSVCILTIIGWCIFAYEARNSKGQQTSKPFFNEYYNAFFLISLTISILLILNYSKVLTFTWDSTWKEIACIFIFSFLFLRWANLNGKYFVWMLPFFLFVATFLSMGGKEIAHYSFFLGPVIESIYGHYHPLVLNIQYGAGLTAFLVIYFKLMGIVSLDNMQFLLKTLMLIQFLLVYAIGVAIYQSRKIAFLVLLTTLFFSFYSVGGCQYYMWPSIGFIRFGFIYLILFCYALQNKLLSDRATNVLTALLGSIAFIWSFESAIYTLPALFFAEYMNKNLKKFLSVFWFCFSFIIALYLFSFLLEKKWPPISHYYEYALVYANGFGQISMGNATSFWWLFPLLYGFILIKILTGEITNKIIIALTIYGMAIFTYFGGRAHPATLLLIAIPFVMLSAYLTLNLRLRSILLKQIMFSLMLIVFFAVNNGLFTGATINVLQEKNIPYLKESFRIFMGRKDQVNLYENPINLYIYPNKALCSSFVNPLANYVEHHSIAILSPDDSFLTPFYACTKTYNALLASPLGQVAINPAAIARTRERAANISNRYILVDTKLFDTINPTKFCEIDLTKVRANILEKLKLVKISELKFRETTFVVFRILHSSK